MAISDPVESLPTAASCLVAELLRGKDGPDHEAALRAWLAFVAAQTPGWLHDVVAAAWSPAVLHLGRRDGWASLMVVAPTVRRWGLNFMGETPDLCLTAALSARAAYPGIPWAEDSLSAEDSSWAEDS